MQEISAHQPFVFRLVRTIHPLAVMWTGQECFGHKLLQPWAHPRPTTPNVATTSNSECNGSGLGQARDDNEPRSPRDRPRNRLLMENAQAAHGSRPIARQRGV